MATISSAGVGSGLDINSLVSQLVAAERAPKDGRLTREDVRLTEEFSALAVLKGAISSLQGAANSVRTPAALALSKATVRDEQFFTASVSSAAVAGSYDVEVEQLATAARLGSEVYLDGSGSVVGTGTLTITVGTKSFSIDVTQESDTLAQIRDAINADSDNSTVRATLVGDASGSYLVLTGTATGAANSITVSATGADAGLQALVDDLNAFDADRDVAAQDAIVHVSGYEIRGTTNAISGAIDGVTLNLKKATAGESVALVVERDDAAIQKKAEGFVNAYNALAQQVKTLGHYDAATRIAGPMLGDSLLRGLDTQLRRILSDPVPGTTGNYRTLNSLGISVTSTGSLQLDAARFNEALAADPQAVNRVFASESGVGVRVAAYLDERLSSTGEFATRNARIDGQRRRLEQEREALDARMLVVQQRYLKQFTAMDGLLAQMQSTSSYLSQQLEGLAKAR
ncbi:MAG: flagellar filament capping protein FliD [Pseudomonadota bacterium]|nr:flagellar filament capping protein FliD [Pseudomonadota bacterium]